MCKQLVDDPPEANQLMQANGQANQLMQANGVAAPSGGTGVGLGPGQTAAHSGQGGQLAIGHLPANGGVTTVAANQPTPTVAATTVATSYRNRDHQIVPHAVVQPIQRPKPPQLARSNSLPLGSPQGTAARQSNAALLAQAQVAGDHIFSLIFSTIFAPFP